MKTLEDWAQLVADELGVARPDTREVLDLARDVAHGVERPAAPLTAWLAGAAPPWLDCDDAEDLRVAEAFARDGSGQPTNRQQAGQKEADG